MAHYELDTKDLKHMASKLRAGDTVSLTGIVYTARDAAHKRLLETLQAGNSLPLDLDGATIYYAGPTPEKPGQVVGSIGPTTSGRMDPYTPTLLEQGLCCMIGKGIRNEAVCQSIAEQGAVYMVAIGGAGALIASAIESLTVIAYEDLGCESMKRLQVKQFPAIVAIDSVGGNLYKQGMLQYQTKNKQKEDEA